MVAIDDKTICWVSGAFQGIGLELTRRLVKDGAKVLMVDICDAEKGEKLARQVGEEGPGTAAYFRSDLTKVDEVRAALEQPLKVFGAPASIVAGNAGMVVKDDDPKAVTMLELNTVGVVIGTQIAAELMSSKGVKNGIIINTASLAGLTPVPNTPAYAASKWAVVGHTLSLAGLHKEAGIRVNCICPALINTPAVGSFFAEEFTKPGASKALNQMAKMMMEPSVVVDAFMQVIADDTLVAKAVVVSPAKTFVHNPRVEMTVGQILDPNVQAYVDRSKI